MISKIPLKVTKNKPVPGSPKNLSSNKTKDTEEEDLIREETSQNVQSVRNPTGTQTTQLINAGS